MKRSALKGLIAGMVLGDGGVYCYEGRNAFLRIQHSLRQQDYLQHKAALLRELTATRINDISGKYPGIAVTTRNHPLYTRLRKLAYPNGKKTVTKTWLSWLTPQGLALWYMDDGNLARRMTDNGWVRHSVGIATCAYSLEDHQILVDFLNERFGVASSVVCANIAPRLYIPARATGRFFDIVNSYIIPSMQYKIDPTIERDWLYERRSAKTEEIVRTP